MKLFSSEPVMVIVAGGATLVQAIMQTAIAFGMPLTSAQQTAITTLTTIVFGLIARSQVSPTP